MPVNKLFSPKIWRWDITVKVSQLTRSTKGCRRGPVIVVISNTGRTDWEADRQTLPNIDRLCF